MRSWGEEVVPAAVAMRVESARNASSPSRLQNWPVSLRRRRYCEQVDSIAPEPTGWPRRFSPSVIHPVFVLVRVADFPLQGGPLFGGQVGHGGAEILQAMNDIQHAIRWRRVDIRQTSRLEFGVHLEPDNKFILADHVMGHAGYKFDAIAQPPVEPSYVAR